MKKNQSCDFFQEQCFYGQIICLSLSKSASSMPEPPNSNYLDQNGENDNKHNIFDIKVSRGLNFILFCCGILIFILFLVHSCTRKKPPSTPSTALQSPCDSSSFLHHDGNTNEKEQSITSPAASIPDIFSNEGTTIYLIFI